MTEDTVNPYAPPATESFSETASLSIETLRESGPIVFHGRASGEDLNDYLRAHENVGCGTMLLIGFILGLILFVLAAGIGGGMIYIAIGIIAMLGITFSASLESYRRSVFRSANPNWDAPFEGQLSFDGVKVHRSGVESNYRWDWFDGAVNGQQMVALIPSLHQYQPILISASMLTALNDWDRLLQIAQSLGMHDGTAFTSESRRRDNRLMICSRNRERTVSVAAGDIAFQGTFTTSDLKAMPSKLSKRDRPRRAYLVMAGLAIGTAMVLVGIAQIGGLDHWTLPILFAMYAAALLVQLAVRRIRASKQGQRTIYHLNALANDAGITSDFAVTVTKVPWTMMQLSQSDEESITLSRRDVRQFIVARRDMFDEDGWSRFRKLVASKLG